LEPVVLALRGATGSRELRENQLGLLSSPTNGRGEIGDRGLVRSGEHGERKVTPGLVLGG
jgi:hypothetical protein